MRLLARLWLFEFQFRLRRLSSAAPSRQQIVARSCRYDRIAMPGTDRQAAFNRHMASCLLAATEWFELNEGLTREDARQITQTAFVATGAWLAKAGMAFWLQIDRKPYANLRKTGLAARSRRHWGNGMVLDDVIEEDAVTLQVSQCPFSEFFWNAGRSDLTETLCLWDGAWMSHVNKARKGIKVSRPTTIASGCDSCAFVFEDAPRKQGCPGRRLAGRDGPTAT